MTEFFDTTVRDAMLDDLGDAFDSGTLEIYAGTQPTDADTAIGAQTLLASISVPATAFAASSSGSKAKAGTWEDSSANATGTAAFFRLKNSGDTKRIDGSVATSGADLNLDSVSITSGQTVTVTGFTLTLAAS